MFVKWVPPEDDQHWFETCSGNNFNNEKSAPPKRVVLMATKKVKGWFQ
jgi:hypothetical protein